MRVGPSVSDRKVATERNGAMLTVVCRTWGETVSGAEGSTTAWSKLATGDYVSEAFVHWSPEQPFIPWCGEAPRSVPPATTAEFIKQAVAPAQASMNRYDVPASVTIAQAILESGSGASTLTRIDHAVFGMKCFGDPGPVAVGCRSYGTHECGSNGKCYSTSASFRAYKTETDSFTDHGLMLSTLQRYQSMFTFTNDPDKFAQALQKAGYATSPKYAANLISVMKRYNLYQYDRTASAPPTCLRAGTIDVVATSQPTC